MILLPIPNLETWLANQPDELDKYKESRKPPFNLDCFNQASLKHLEVLLKHLAKNDEYNRAKALNYAQGSRQSIVQEMRGLFQAHQIKDVQTIVENIKEDQVLQTISLCRYLSQPFWKNEGWQQRGDGLPADQHQELTLLQQKWQGCLPFAFCTSQDLLDKIHVLDELDRYEWIATHYYQKTEKSLPDGFRHEYKNWLKQFSKDLLRVKQTIAGTMLALLQAISTSGDLKCNSLLNTDVIPLLKKLGVLKPKMKALGWVGSLDAAQFSGLVTFIQTHGSPDQQRKLSKLPLFKSDLEDPLPLKSTVTLSGHFIQVPAKLQDCFKPLSNSWLEWLSLRSADRRRQEQCFDMKTTYHLLALNQQYRQIQRRMLDPNGTSLNDHMTTLQAIEKCGSPGIPVVCQIKNYQLPSACPRDPGIYQHLWIPREAGPPEFRETQKCEQQLEGEGRRVQAIKPSGIGVWLFSRTHQMMEAWSSQLQEEQKHLLIHKITLAESIIQAMENVSETPGCLTPDLLKSVQALFRSLPSQIKRFPKKTVVDLKHKVDSLSQRYQLTAKYSQRFIKQVIQPQTFLMNERPFAKSKVLQFDRSLVHAWIQSYSTLVQDNDAKAMQLIGKMINAEEYPTWQHLQETLIPLFNSDSHPVDVLKQFLEQLVKNIILPALRSEEEPGFKFAYQIAPILTQQWASERRTELATAIQIVQQVFSVEASKEIALDEAAESVWVQNEKMTLTYEKVKQSIEAICAFSLPNHDYTSYIRMAVLYYLEDRPEHKGYSGDNLVYHQMITDAALATGDNELMISYGMRRFCYLLNSENYNAILQDPFLTEHKENPKLKQSIQAQLDLTLTEPLAERYVGLLPVIQSYGTDSQSQRYAEERDCYQLEKLAQLLSGDEVLTREKVDNFLRYLRSLGQAFPLTAKGRNQLQMQLRKCQGDRWQPSIQSLITQLGDEDTRQSYQLIWLKTVLSEPSHLASCLEHFDYQQPYSGWIAALGEHQAEAVHTVIEQFLKDYNYTYPKGLEIVKAILSSQWITTHHPDDLVDKIAEIDEICQKQTELQGLTQSIHQQLSQGDYKVLASQLKHLLNHQEYCQDHCKEDYPESQRTYQVIVETLTTWLKQAVFNAPIAIASVKTIILPVLSEGEAKHNLDRLCEYAEESRFTYDRLLIAINQIAADPTKLIAPIEKLPLSYIEQGWPLDRRQQLSNEIETVKSKLNEGHPFKPALSSLQRLLLGTSLDLLADRANMQALLISEESNPPINPPLQETPRGIQVVIEKRCMDLLDRIEGVESWELGQLIELDRYYRFVKLSSEPQPFTQRVTKVLGILIGRVLALLAEPEKWSHLSRVELNRQGQQVTDDIEIIRKLGSNNAIQSVDKALDSWLFSYCRLFRSLPQTSHLLHQANHASLCEELLLVCGNEGQQNKIKLFKGLRINGHIQQLNRACTSTLQGADLKPLADTLTSQFLSGFHRCLQRLCSPGSPELNEQMQAPGPQNPETGRPVGKSNCYP